MTTAPDTIEDLDQIVGEDIPCYEDPCQTEVSWRLSASCSCPDSFFCDPHKRDNEGDWQSGQRSFSIMKCADCLEVVDEVAWYRL